METALKVHNLSKHFKRRIRKPGLAGAIVSFFSSDMEIIKAVENVSFSIRRGEKVGLIGENGAGKSTILKMLTGILVPSLGTLKVLDRVPWQERRQLALNIGVVFGQRPQLLWDIPVRETFRLLRTMYRIPDAVYEHTYQEAVRRLNLESLLPVPVRQLSLGQRMRCDLAASLLHAPAVAFLDEPTLGLDLSVKEQVREFILDMQERFGTTLLITTHDLKDITETCDRLLLLDKGRLLFDGSLKAFEKRFASERRIVAELQKPLRSDMVVRITREVRRYGGRVLDSEGHKLVVGYRKEGAAPALTRFMLKRLPVADLNLEKTDIETIVAKLYRRGTSREHRP